MQHYIIRLTSINLCQPRFLRSLSGLIPAFALILLLGRSSLVFMVQAVGGFFGLFRRSHKLRVPRWMFLACAVLCAGRGLAAPTNKWDLTIDFGESSPAIGSDGTLYFGTFHEKFWA